MDTVIKWRTFTKAWIWLKTFKVQAGKRSFEYSRAQSFGPANGLAKKPSLMEVGASTNMVVGLCALYVSGLWGGV